MIMQLAHCVLPSKSRAPVRDVNWSAVTSKRKLFSKHQTVQYQYGCAADHVVLQLAVQQAG
jgi:hypothetical protein